MGFDAAVVECDVVVDCFLMQLQLLDWMEADAIHRYEDDDRDIDGTKVEILLSGVYILYDSHDDIYIHEALFCLERTGSTYIYPTHARS